MNGLQNNTPKKKKGCLHYILIAFAVFFGFAVIGSFLDDSDAESSDKAYEAGKAVGEAVGEAVADVTDQTAETETVLSEITKEDYIAACEQVDYTSVERDPGLFEGKQIVVKGEVIQVMEGWFNSVTMRIESDAGMWYATYTAGENESRILEGDYLTVYGECDGVESYTTLLGGQLTIPSIKVKYYDLTEKFTVSEQDAENKIYAGHYKVGTDIPAGYYYLFPTDSLAYFKYSSDANGEDIIENDNFSSHTMISVHNGEYLELKNCYALPWDADVKFNTVDGYLEEGFYVVGLHIPAGEYKLEAIAGDLSFPFYSIYGDLRRDDIIANGLIEGSRYVDLKDGQYLKISDCKIYIGE